MTALIKSEDLPRWVPGTVTHSSANRDWRGVSLCGYRYLGQEVQIPAMRDFMIVSYERGATPMERRFDGTWTRARCAPGSISLHTRAQRSEWTWNENIDVRHIYLTNEFITDIASEALDKRIEEVVLRDLLNIGDPVITGAATALSAEASTTSVGGSMYAEAVATQLALHLLRTYANVSIGTLEDKARLTPVQADRVSEFISTHLAGPISVDMLAGECGLGACRFAERFRRTFGCAPYAYVLRCRAERARELIETSALPLKQIAPTCGFNDQAHMNRVFKARYGVTPGRVRRERH